jgi:hypothetical protein
MKISSAVALLSPLWGASLSVTLLEVVSSTGCLGTLG